MKVYIYSLEDPITKEIRYIGKTNNIKMRFHNHLNKKHNEKSHKRNWINSLRKQGYKPIMQIIDEVENDEWKYWERYWIAQFIAWGFNLVNHTSGGEGLSLGNQTSFKKGGIPWNKGKGHKETCVHCNKSFNCNKAKKRKYCSSECFGNSQKEKPYIKGAFKIGHPSWSKGKTYLKSKTKRVFQYDLNGNFIKKFDSCKKASLEMNCIPENIRRCCAGKSKTAKGFKWKYE